MATFANKWFNTEKALKIINELENAENMPLEARKKAYGEKGIILLIQTLERMVRELA